MAVLDAAGLVAARRGMLDEQAISKDHMSYLKNDHIAAFAAADQWVSDNAAAYNAALPVAFRTTATAAQKAMVLMHVVRVRFLTGV